MDGGRRQGRPDEELFLRPSNKNDPDTPTIGPLRINKRESNTPAPLTSTSPPPRVGSAASATDSFSRPVAAQPPYPVAPTSPPTGPLPYPDEKYRQRTYTPVSEAERSSKNATPEESGRRRSSATQPSGSPRTRFDASDPNRPTLSGYAQPPAAQTSRLAERRGNAPKPLPESPGPDTPDKDGLFQKQPYRTGASSAAGGSSQPPGEPAAANPYPEFHQQYWPPSSSTGPDIGPSLKIPNPAGINRLSSTASNATTKAQRGSPPPPETPIIGPPAGGIEARYAAAGIAGTSTLSSIQAQNAAAAQRTNPYVPVARPEAASPAQLQQQAPPARPWTPTEQPGSQPHGPPTVYQGPNAVNSTSPQPPAANTPPSQVNRPAGPGNDHVLEQDFHRMNIHDEPPPAYSSVSQPAPGASAAQGFPTEKRTGISQPTPGPAVMTDPNLQGHPAFANDLHRPGQSPQPAQVTNVAAAQPGPSTSSPGPGPGPASPPPLPEGWIAHLDPSSGQYYYIHLATQSTQWEFPKGPTPLNLNEPMSPTAGTFVNPLASPGFSSLTKPLASPGLPTQHAAYHESSLAGLSSPTAAGFTGPPPAAGVDMFKVTPTNGVYFGPYLRYTNMDVERGIWLGSILLVTDAPHPPTIHIHQSMDLSPNPRQLKANPIFNHQRWTFFRYDIDLKMEDEQSAKWTYAVTSHLGCTRYEFLVAGRHETNWRFIAHSGNDFALNVSANERSKLGGVGFMWKDVLQKHTECGGFHVQLGLGNQIYADRIWKEIPLLKQWTATSGKENRKNAPWTAKHEEEVSHAYFHYYTSHLDQPHLREAFAQIPHILSLDDHDL